MYDPLTERWEKHTWMWRPGRRAIGEYDIKQMGHMDSIKSSTAWLYSPWCRVHPSGSIHQNNQFQGSISSFWSISINYINWIQISSKIDIAKSRLNLEPDQQKKADSASENCMTRAALAGTGIDDSGSPAYLIDLQTGGSGSLLWSISDR